MPHPAHLPRRLLFWLLLLPILLGTGCMLQDHLLYYPERISATEVATRFPGLRPWPAAGDLRGYLVEPRVAPRGTVVVLHGNAGHAAQRGWYAEELGRIGWRVLLAEYPGYGPRPGKPGEETLVADARETLRLALREFGSPLLVIGESLGAAVAAGAVGGHGDEIAGLILITPWDRLASVAQHHYPLFPATLFLHDTYDSAAQLQDFAGASVVVLAQEDRIIPAEIGRKLFAGLPGEKRLLEIPRAGHNDWPAHVDASWWSRLIEVLVPPR
jgi:pimeloyl-ACP methyl ester carboxylesterase